MCACVVCLCLCVLVCACMRVCVCVHVRVHVRVCGFFEHMRSKIISNVLLIRAPRVCLSLATAARAAHLPEVISDISSEYMTRKKYDTIYVACTITYYI